MWACAEWMSKIGRKEANSIAGEEILFKNDKSKAKTVEGMVDPSKKCIAPLFNVVSIVSAPGYVRGIDGVRIDRKMIVSAPWPILATS